MSLPYHPLTATPIVPAPVCACFPFRATTIKTLLALVFDDDFVPSKAGTPAPLAHENPLSKRAENRRC